MNKRSMFPGILVVLLLISTFGFKIGNRMSNSTESEIPEEVNSIIQNKCFGCHNTDSKNNKAKDKLDFKMFDSLSGPDKVHKLRDIGDVLKEDEMPPKKFLDRNPDKALTKDEHKTLMSWAKKEARNAMKN